MCSCSQVSASAVYPTHCTRYWIFPSRTRWPVITFTEGRFDTGKKIDYLRAVVEFALEREDLGSEFRTILAEIAKREGLG